MVMDEQTDAWSNGQVENKCLCLPL